RAPHIGRKMQRVGLQRVARIFSSHASERPRARYVDRQSDQQYQNGRDAWLDVHVVEEQAIKRLINDVESCQRQQPGFDERGKILKLAVPVGMLLIRRLVR